MTSLAEPLARALVRIGGKTMPHMDTWAVPVLAVLRNDPETLAALAEALHPVFWTYEPHDPTVGDCEICVSTAAALADALLGSKP